MSMQPFLPPGSVAIIGDEKVLVSVSIKRPTGAVAPFCSLELNTRTGAASMSARAPRILTADVLRRLDELAELVQAARAAVLNGSV